MRDLSPPKFSPSLRRTGETSERSVCVRYFYKTKDTEFVWATRVKVEPAYSTAKAATTRLVLGANHTMSIRRMVLAIAAVLTAVSSLVWAIRRRP